MKTEQLKVTLTLLEDQLGTIPKDKELYASYIATKAPIPEAGKEEVLTVQEIEEKGWTGFHKDKEGIFIYDYMIRGFLKAAGMALKGQMNLKNAVSKIDQFVFVFPRKIHPEYENKPIKEPHGMVERPLRAMTMQGPRVTLSRSDFLKAGCKYEFEITIIENDKGISSKVVRTLFEYGKFAGLGQFRNGSYGRFEVSIK